MRPYSRGNRALALSIARDPDTRREAVDDIVADAFSTNSAGPRAAKLRTWREILIAARLDEHAPPTVETLRVGAGALRAAGYRSAMS